MSIESEYFARRKKQKEKEELEALGNAMKNAVAKNSVEEEYFSARKQGIAEEVYDDIAPVRTTYQSGGIVRDTKQKEDKQRWYEGWFDGGAFSDGYDIGDVTKTLLGTMNDVSENVHEAVFDATENLIDTGAYIVGGVGGLFSDKFQDKVKKFIAKDLQEDVVDWVTGDPEQDKKLGEVMNKWLNWTQPLGVAQNLWLGDGTESASVLGEKADSMVQSATHMAGYKALNAIPVAGPIVSNAAMIVNGFGGEIENAFQNDATYGEAGVSGAISAGVEWLTEKISGGFKIGKLGTMDDGIQKALARKISNKTWRTIAKFGIDTFGEGLEEFLSGLGSAIGQKMTYMDEKELSELFSTEDALESFISGAVLGAVGGGVQIGTSAVTGRDYTTKLTANEEAVVKKVYEAELAKAKENGEKVNKNKLWDDIVKQMDEGEISIDTIEEVLGGDEYTAYRNLVDEQNAHLKELAGLFEGDELKAQTENYLSDSKRSEMKSQLGKNVFGKVITEKGSRLLNSYAETEARGVKFTADVDAYEGEYAKKTIQNIIAAESGNNTRRMHALADLLAKTSEDKKTVFSITDAKKLAGTSFAFKNQTTDGYVVRDANGVVQEVVINLDSPKYLNRVVGHEVTHVLEGTEFYDTFRGVVEEYAESKGEYKTRLADAIRRYGDKDGYTGQYGLDNIKKEVVADLVGDYIFSDSDFVKTLSVKNRNIFQKIYDEIKYLCKVATAGSKEARDLERVKKAFEDAYRADTVKKTDAKTTLSVSEDGNYGYHAGDLGKAEGYWNMVSSNRGTGHFGTGTYFVGNEAQISGDSTYGIRPHEKVDFSNYKLFKPLYEGEGFSLHSALKYINDNASLYPISKISFSEAYDIRESADNALYTLSDEDATDAEKAEAQKVLDDLKERFESIGYDPDYMYPEELFEKLGDLRDDYRDARRSMGMIFSRTAGGIDAAEAKFDSVMQEIYDEVSKIDDAYNARYQDSSSTRFMKKMGYEGIDVRGFKGLDNTAYGSVIYDLKGEDLARKQEIGTAKFSLSEAGLDYDATSGTASYSLTSFQDSFGIEVEKGIDEYRKARADYENALAKSIAEDPDSITDEERAKASRYLDNLFLIGEMIANDKDRLDYEAAVNKSAWVSNTEYGGSIDFSTLCAKRRIFTGTFDAIQEALPDTVLTENDFLTIRNLLLESGEEAPCSMCYVEGARAKHGLYVAKFITDYKKTNPEWVPQIADFASANRLEQTRIQHPKAYEKYVEAMSKLSQRKPKEASVRTDYKGEILDAFKDNAGSVAQKNINGGIRFNSFSDFEIIHALDCMQVLTDMSRVGLNGQAYTKVKEFAEAFGNTGLKINLSLVAKDVDENGNLVFDEINGMKYSEANDLRNRYSENVGTVIVVFNDAQLKAALADSTIDYVLPFHRSQWKKSQYDAMGLPEKTREYTVYQNDKVKNPKTGRWVNLGKIKHKATYTNDITGETYEITGNIMPNQYWDYNADGRTNAQRYLDYINSNGLAPKFYFLLDNVDGKWALPEGAVGDGYFKLLIDFKMYNNEGWGSPQKPVTPDFNMSHIQKMLDDYKGGHKSFPVAQGVVDKFVAGKKTGKYQSYPENVAPLKPSMPNFELPNTMAMSLSENGVAPVKQSATEIRGEDVRLQKKKEIAPVVQSAQAKTENVQGAINPATPDGFAPIPEQVANQQQSENISTITDADAPVATEEPYYGEPEAPAKVKNPFDNRDYSNKDMALTKGKSFVEENPDVKSYFVEAAQGMLYDVQNSVKGERYTINDADGYIVGWDGTKRSTTQDIANLLDNKYAKSYADIENALNRIINGEKLNALAKRIEFDLHDRLVNGYTDMDGMEIPANQEYIDLMRFKQETDEAYQQYQESVDYIDDDFAPVAESVSAAPVKEQKPVPYTRGQQAKLDPNMEEVAEVLTEEPEAVSKERSLWQYFLRNFVDKKSIFETISLKKGNRELQARADALHRADSSAQYLMKNGDKSKGVKSLDEMRKTVQKSGKEKAFSEYVYHVHNIDRMSLESRVAPKIAELQEQLKGYSEEQIETLSKEFIKRKTPEADAAKIRAAREYVHLMGFHDKPVFGDSVTADVSRQKVAEFERNNPEFKEWANDLYNYTNHLRQMMIDNGIISQETADLWSSLYPHYVPIRRVGKDGMAVNVALDTNKTGINAPIKRATGGNSNILPLFDTLGARTVQTYNAVAKNRFGVELKNTLNSTVTKSKTTFKDAINSVENHEGLLKEGKDGMMPTFTVFENGERVEFEITEDMFDAMRPTSKALSVPTKPSKNAPLSKKVGYAIKQTPAAISSFRRGVLTEYNPYFMLTNMAKDVQDVLVNSQHPGRTYKEIPNAIWQIMTKGEHYQERMAHGGESDTYFERDTNTFKEKSTLRKVVGFPLDMISKANNVVEQVPRLAEYIASRKMGRSIDVSMLDAARVTTNFAAGGDITKFANRNGFTFLNASVQGAAQQVRNIREAKHKGLKGWVGLAARYAVAGLPVLLLNHLLWEDDEEYEELSDYVKQDYYIVAKNADGTFVRIPKGRAVSVIQNAFEQMGNLITGDDEADFGQFFQLVMNNLAPNNPLDNNIISPIVQAATNKTWYGEDLVPTRLQDLPAEEQYDESTDAISKWLGENTGISPYKINYLLDQYSGVVGDVVLPTLTPDAERGDGSVFTAPLLDKFTTDSTMKNQNVSDFYTLKDELTVKANASTATDEDYLKSSYMNAINSELSELYAQKREIQNDTYLSDEAKYSKVRAIQQEIVDLTREAMESYEDVNIQGTYATVGDVQYRYYTPGEDSTAEPGWRKLSDKQIKQQNEVTRGLGISASEYWSNNEEYDYAYEKPEKYAVARAVGGYKTFRNLSSKLNKIKADKDSSGKSISGSRKNKVIDYISELDLDYGEKIILFKSEYNADDTYNYEIIDYLNSRRDLSYKDIETILKELGFTVDSNGNIYWD